MPEPMIDFGPHERDELHLYVLGCPVVTDATRPKECIEIEPWVPPPPPRWWQRPISHHHQSRRSKAVC